MAWVPVARIGRDIKPIVASGAHFGTSAGIWIGLFEVLVARGPQRAHGKTMLVPEAMVSKTAVEMPEAWRE